MSNNRFVQRRKYARFKVNGAIIGVPRSNYMKIGQIVNISRGGLSFQYVDGGMGLEEFPYNAELSILWSEKNFHLERIPFITVSDAQIQPIFSEMRLRCVQFGEVSPSQQTHLDFFIECLTSGPFGKERRRHDRRHKEADARNNWKASFTIDRRSGRDRRQYYQ